MPVTILKKIASGYKKLHDASKISISIGAITMSCFYITAIVAFLIAPHVNYINAMLIHRGCLEAAPASMASGVCAGLLGDLMLKRRGGG